MSGRADDCERFLDLSPSHRERRLDYATRAQLSGIRGRRVDIERQLVVVSLRVEDVLLCESCPRPVRASVPSDRAHQSLKSHTVKREDFVPQRLAVDEKGFLAKNAADRQLLHALETAVLSEDVKDARDALGLLAVGADTAVGHHLARVHVPDLEPALAEDRGHGRRAGACMVGRSTGLSLSLSGGRGGLAVDVHAVVRRRVCVGIHA